MNPFGTYVRTKREEAGMTLTEFARQLEISPAYWSRIETGRENPPKDELIKKAATILGLSEDELFIEASRLPPDMQEEVAEVVRLYRSLNKKP
ncbi:helix-turn-helix transcriptional regulator [Limnohabitans sp. 15K]|jgi:transcriptional regulator with XRE-family HTH domain|uniref:helix-turn-helix domain-containing protein n=1 Tax=Limnohabitans sp. 15K TaxID=1100706 RepID=UPI000C1F77AF|nr:helix-turn-helix transcriptional regulator [Limnohabitans sp. 15K]PIT81949.1 transcriptional regulator [Limnohabitans sp. 15K]